MNLLPYGEAALLVELDVLDEVLALYAALSDDPLPGIVDLVPAARTLLVSFDPSVTDAERVGASLRAVTPRRGARPDVGCLDVPVTYDGEDLAEVAELTGLSERDVVAAHTGQEWTVAFCGFAPGFGYLVGTDDRLYVPRRRTPRTRVPTGAVGLAGEFAGVYPRESPGGWQLIGRTGVPVWDLERDPPSLLRPGVRVRFVEAS